MFGYAKLSMFMFECMLLSVEPALNLIKLKFTGLSLGDRLEKAKNCWSIYIYLYALRVLVLQLFNDRLEMSL